MSTIIIGAGPIASSIAASLSTRSPSTKIIMVAPSSPLISSHNDLGRIARSVDAEGNPIWVARNHRSLSLYQSIEKRSNITFFHPVGSLIVGSQEFLEPMISSLNAAHIPFTPLSFAALKARYPSLRLAPHHSGILEENAGYINPLSLIAANKQIFADNGGEYVDATVETITRLSTALEAPSFEVTLDNHQTLTATRLIVAAGALTASLLSHLNLSVATPHRISKRTVALVPPSPTSLPHLANLPVLKYQCPTASSTGLSAHDAMEASSVYVLPPLPYPDGRTYMKIGGGPNDYLPDTPDPRAALTEFLSSPGDPELLATLADALGNGVLDSSIGLDPPIAKTCVTTCSDDDELVIEEVAAGVFAVCGCQGKGASPGPAIGEEVLDLILGE